MNMREKEESRLVGDQAAAGSNNTARGKPRNTLERLGDRFGLESWMVKMWVALSAPSEVLAALLVNIALSPVESRVGALEYIDTHFPPPLPQLEAHFIFGPWIWLTIAALALVPIYLLAYYIGLAALLRLIRKLYRVSSGKCGLLGSEGRRRSGKDNQRGEQEVHKRLLGRNQARREDPLV
jgi:hypothetical protein